MSAEIILLIGLGAAAGFAIAPRMLRQSAVEEMGLLLENGSSESLSRIMVAVFTIGLIGFALDRLMLVFQNLITRR